MKNCPGPNRNIRKWKNPSNKKKETFPNNYFRAITATTIIAYYSSRNTSQ